MNELTYEEIVDKVRGIVQADPLFIYPQQGDYGDNAHCDCVEVEDYDDPDREYPEEQFIYADCPWHMDDDNTCRYVQDDGAPACVVGHYFVKELGFDDLAHFEAKSPKFILDVKGYDIDVRAERFLSTIQSRQDQGWEWEQAFESAIAHAENPIA
jgi:hypothetical protein